MYYLADVIVEENYRGKGIGKALIERITIAENELQKMYGILLTSDAHTLYSKYGFKEIEGKCMCRF